MSNPTSFLSINDLKLSVNLGWTAEERAKKQIVWLNANIFFMDAPKACTTDELSDTLCYATLIEQVRKKMGAKKYRLIESLTQDIYAIIKANVVIKTKLTVQITKHPQIKGLTGGVIFSYGDN
jgi:dihydroneopterin aldolase